MAFVEVSQSRRYPKYAECEEGDVLVDGAWFIEEFEGKFGAQFLFRHEDGSETVLGKSGQLKFLIDNKIKPMDFVKVVYAGKIVLDKGTFKGKESHQFKVFVDPSRSGKVGTFREVGSTEPAAGDDETF